MEQAMGVRVDRTQGEAGGSAGDGFSLVLRREELELVREGLAVLLNIYTRHEHRYAAISGILAKVSSLTPPVGETAELEPSMAEKKAA